MKTSENAPRTSGSAARAAASTPGCPAPFAALPFAELPFAAELPLAELPFASLLTPMPVAANSAVRTSVSEVARPASAADWPPSRPASSRVLIRLPLCPSARLADGVARNVGCAFSQTDDPLVEYRQCPTAM